ncbi:serine hydrolase domain-containing protein [Clostridium sp. C2-6-12]|uniref:serine hydrolase domain-containing protein n=1 Tax=Clostridium sp. C2-6-12 TaxID=2698832 RepID=UPI001FAC22B0|nr:serine hydrolase domain-containing protein [Clostridium sp. C2-6-12]
MANFSDLDKLLQDFVDGGLPGCSLQIAQKGKTIYEGYFGYKDIETKAPITNNSVFRLASMSKIPLYTTLMILYERGMFLMSDPIHKYFPEWKNTRKFVKEPNGDVKIVTTDGPITIRDTLSMKCGLPYCNSAFETENHTLKAMQKYMQPLWDKGHYTNREHIAAMSQVPLEFEPGSHWMYGFSSELAAGLVEALCNKPINDVFQEILFDPLEMKDTRAHYYGDIEERMVSLYSKTPEGKLEAGPDFFDRKHLPGPENEAGWARLFTTCNDFSKLMQMLANGGVHNGVRIMGRKTIDLMRTNGLNEVQMRDYENPYEAGYGYGYGVRTLMDKHKGNHNGSIGSFGWTGGFGTWCEADPEDGVSIVYMHNLIPSEEAYYHPRIRNVAYGCIE